MFLRKFCLQDPKFKRKFQVILETAFWGKSQLYAFQWRSDKAYSAQHSMGIVLVTRFHIWFIMALYYKMRQILLLNATATLFQNATEVYYKMRQFYHKMWQLLQNATILLQNMTVITKATFITNCESTNSLPKSSWLRFVFIHWAYCLKKKFPIIIWKILY